MKKNAWILLIMCVWVAIVALVATFLPEATINVADLADTSEVIVSNELEATAEPSIQAEETEGVQAYVLITIGGVSYEPIALTGDGQYITLRQGDAGLENTVYVTSHSMRMEHANCDNQDCIEQGEVTLDNKDERLLGDFIVCLPNQVTLELLTAKEWEQKISAQ